MPPTCDLVIPCRDEAPALGELLRRVPEQLSVIVVDNGSRDHTAEVARALGATVVVEPQPGYGAAVHAGVLASEADLVAVIDGDGTLDPRELLPLLDAVVSGDCGLAVGRRRPVCAGLTPWPAKLGNTAVSWWLRRHGVPVHDIAPARVCWRVQLLALDITDRRFGYPAELLRKAALAGWQIREYDVSYGARAAGTRSKVSGSVLGTVRAGADVLRVLS
jgi:glycosyltransferase involved in cell wall biosynthesis